MSIIILIAIFISLVYLALKILAWVFRPPSYAWEDELSDDDPYWNEIGYK